MRQISDMIAFLVVPNQAQGGCGIENGFGQNAGEQEPHLVNRQSRGDVLKFHAQTDQEMMGQGNEQDMVMPTQPTAGFIMVEADFTFAFFKNDFDRPTHAAETNQVKQGGVCRRVAEVELEFSRVVNIAL